jgi:hypothetical protein
MYLDTKICPDTFILGTSNSGWREYKVWLQSLDSSLIYSWKIASISWTGEETIQLLCCTEMFGSFDELAFVYISYLVMVCNQLPIYVLQEIVLFF